MRIYPRVQHRCQQVIKKCLQLQTYLRVAPCMPDRQKLSAHRRMNPGFEKIWNCRSVSKWSFEASSCKLLLQAAYFLQVFTFPNRFSPQRKTLRVLAKDWPKLKNCTKLDTHPASAFEVNGQTGEHCCHSHTRNCHSHHKTCHKPACPLPKGPLHPTGSSSFFPSIFHFPFKVFSPLLCWGFCSRKLSTLSR